MKIKWLYTFEVEIVETYDEEMDNIGSSNTEVIKKG